MFDFWQEKDAFLFTESSIPVVGVHAASYSLCIRDSFTGCNTAGTLTFI
jgi:hypothetical protein